MAEDIAAGAALAAELVNTRARPARPEDTLAAFAAAHDAGVSDLRALREDLLRVYEGDVGALNRWLVPPRVEQVDGRWVLRVADEPCAVAAHGLAWLIAERGLDRIGFCAADDCQAVYADTTARGARRYCSRTCSTRTNVRRHRAP